MCHMNLCIRTCLIQLIYESLVYSNLYATCFFSVSIIVTMQEFPPKKIFEAKYENLCDYKNSLEATFVF